ncbi:hypothetical protein [Haladaptatus halobius]|uniref:hypothetical protein n=1 Tax=Haladaptatus halobius TaxID=2884875 RepID=UPI001D0B4792|nr:hypothetical protein [Haladaptatus halobius]
MTEPEPLSQPSGNDSLMSLNPSTAEGRSQILLFGGLGWLAIGNIVDIALIVWSGVAIVTLAFILNTSGKLVHYQQLSIPRSDRLKLSVSWLLLALTVVGLLTTYASARYSSGEGNFFWPLAVAGIGFGLLHMAAQSLYLPTTEESIEQ